MTHTCSYCHQNIDTLTIHEHVISCQAVSESNTKETNQREQS